MDKETYIEQKRQQAAAAFVEGKNCCQAVLTAFAEEVKLDPTLLMQLGCGFGGGVARQREGLLSSSGETDKADKDAVYARVRTLCDAFKEKNGSIVCRELLAGVPVTTGGTSEARTETYYKKRPCKEYCADAAELIARRLTNETK